MEVGLILLAGGQSRRMGQNKALLPVAGQENIARIVDSLTPDFKAPVLVTNEQEVYQHLNVTIVKDMYPGKGPLAGIHAGLHASAYPLNLVVACDMPFASRELGQYLVEACSSYDCLIPRIEGKIHPLFAVYKKTCLPALEECLQEDRLRVIYFLEKVQAGYLDESELALPIDVERAFFNMNNPADYQQVQHWLESKE